LKKKYFSSKKKNSTNQSSPDTKFLDGGLLNNVGIFEFVGDNKQVGNNESCTKAELLQKVFIK
jgi:hypothetical protein